MRNERDNIITKISNLKVTDKLFRAVCSGILLFCGCTALFHHYGRNPIIVDKDVRYLTSPFPSRPFRGYYDNNEKLYAVEYGTWDFDGSTYFRPVKKYSCSRLEYNKINRIIDKANKKGPQVLVEAFGDPFYEGIEYDYSLSEYDIAENNSVKLFGEDKQGTFVVEDESAKQNALATFLPGVLALAGGFVAYSEGTSEEKGKTKVRNNYYSNSRR